MATNKQIAKQHKALAEECDLLGMPLQSVDHYWYKKKHISIHSKIDVRVEYLKEIENIVQRLNSRSRLKLPKLPVETGEKAIKATISDAHVGLDPNPDNRSLFAYQYNAKIFNDNLDEVYHNIIAKYNQHGPFDLLLLDDLGDGLDGYNGFTTRGGHKLEQNMNNVEMFQTFVEGKVRLIEQLRLAGIAKEIEVRAVSNCNHGGQFGEIANTAIKMIVGKTMGEGSGVKFNILSRFMEHFKYGHHTFILTHGKDVKYMKHGLPYRLDDKTKNFINSYINHHGIRTPYIHLEKGDLHQVGYERTKKFDYRNFMSFAPPSGYGQHNFEDGYGGFSLQVVPKHSNKIDHTDIYFDFKKSKGNN